MADDWQIRLVLVIGIWICCHPQRKEKRTPEMHTLINRLPLSCGSGWTR
jgi:hypothetical protein